MPTKTRAPIPAEVREGTAADSPEGGEGSTLRRTNRKRSSKGASNTKAPLDAEGGCAGKGKCGPCSKGKPCASKSKKDTSCTMKRDRSDALTAPEYLAACELGIQNRSRTYIRARLDTSGQGQKCGAGYIAANKKCQQSGAGGGPDRTTKRALQKIKANHGTSKLTRAETQAAQAWAQREASTPRARARRAAKTGASLALSAGAVAGLVGSLRLANRLGSRRRRRDGSYPQGFTVDFDQLAI